MIIWGSRSKESDLRTGTFFCPQCRRTSTYRHIRLDRYFTLYFIPLFRTSTLAEYVTCQRCSQDFKTEILKVSPEELQTALSPWECTECGNANPGSETSCLKCNSPKKRVPPPLVAE